MTRGRKKDLTIPPSRALTQQRDYRARKALYLSELENKCQRLQEENEELRAEVAALRAGLPVSSSPNPQLVSVLVIRQQHSMYLLGQNFTDRGFFGAHG